MQSHDKTAMLLTFFIFSLLDSRYPDVSQPFQSWQEYIITVASAVRLPYSYQGPIGCLCHIFSFTDRSVTLSSHFWIATESQSAGWHVVALLIVRTPGRIDEANRDLNN